MARYLGAQCAALHSESSWDRTLGSSVLAMWCRPAGPLPGSAWCNSSRCDCHAYPWLHRPERGLRCDRRCRCLRYQVDTWNTDVTDLNNQPFLQPDYDWDGLAPVERVPPTYCPSHQHHLEPVRLLSGRWTLSPTVSLRS